MKLSGRRQLGLVVTGLAAALAAYSIFASVEKKRTLNKVQAMTQQMKTVCIGRLSLDVPVDALVENGPARLGGVSVSATAGSSVADLHKRIEDLRQGLAGEKNEFDKPSLEREVEVPAVDFTTTVLYYARTKPVTWLELGRPVSSGGTGITVEAYGLKDDVLYHFKGVDLASPQYEKNVERLISAFQSRREDAVPGQPGFCVARGLVHDPISPEDHEQAALFVALKAYPDVAIRIDTAVQNTLATSLLERDANNEANRAHPEAITTLRKGVRSINGIAGEEVLTRIKNEDGTTSHFAMWASRNKLGDVMAPAITLEIETGKGKRGQHVNSSLSDEAVLQLWDKVSPTLRFRATSAGQDDKPAASRKPLGDMSATASTCPQSGYWECSEHGAVVGGRRRFSAPASNSRLPWSLERPTSGRS